MREKSYREQYDRTLRWLTKLEEFGTNVEMPWSESESRTECPGVTYTKRRRKITARVAGEFLFDYEKEGRDLIYAFFQNCWHLKDWLKEDDRVRTLVKSDCGKKKKREGNGCGVCIECFAICDDYLSICSDMCNGSKHSNLKLAKRDKDTDMRKTILKVGVDQDRKLSITGEFVILCKGKEYNALELARSCMTRWTTFISKYGLPES